MIPDAMVRLRVETRLAGSPRGPLAAVLNDRTSAADTRGHSIDRRDRSSPRCGQLADSPRARRNRRPSLPAGRHERATARSSISWSHVRHVMGLQNATVRRGFDRTRRDRFPRERVSARCCAWRAAAEGAITGTGDRAPKCWGLLVGVQIGRVTVRAHEGARLHGRRGTRCVWCGDRDADERR